MKTTIVTCYYRVSSKHSFEQYDQWIQSFFQSIKCPVLLFTSHSLQSYFETLQMKYQKKDLRIVYREFHELEIYRQYPDIWDWQYKMDPQKSIRTKECYILWNSKLYFMEEAIHLNPFHSTYFLWSDIGNVRQPFLFEIDNYPLSSKISCNQIDIVLIHPFPKEKEDDFFFNSVHLSGSIMGGTKETFLKLIPLYKSTFQHYLNHEKFIGCDQQIFHTLYWKNPELFHLIYPLYQEKVDPWFFLYYYYSN